MEKQDTVRVCAVVPAALHKRLRHLAVDDDSDAQALMIQALLEYLARRGA